jgi:hypothetical protein
MTLCLQAKWRFSSILKLPWRPRLAAAGATTYVFDKKTGLVTQHIEEWDVEALKVIQQLLKPAGKPTTDAEKFMDNLARGEFVLAAVHTGCKVLSCKCKIATRSIQHRCIFGRTRADPVGMGHHLKLCHPALGSCDCCTGGSPAIRRRGLIPGLHFNQHACHMPSIFPFNCCVVHSDTDIDLASRPGALL